jgi:hypothetical protein
MHPLVKMVTVELPTVVLQEVTLLPKVVVTVVAEAAGMAEQLVFVVVQHLIQTFMTMQKVLLAGAQTITSTVAMV